MQQHDTEHGRIRGSGSRSRYAPLIACLATVFVAARGHVQDNGQRRHRLNAIETVYHAFCVVVNRIA